MKQIGRPKRIAHDVVKRQKPSSRNKTIARSAILLSKKQTLPLNATFASDGYIVDATPGYQKHIMILCVKTHAHGSGTYAQVAVLKQPRAVL